MLPCTQVEVRFRVKFLPKVQEERVLALEMHFFYEFLKIIDI